jgi:hypothetical protein
MELQKPSNESVLEAPLDARWFRNFEMITSTNESVETSLDGEKDARERTKQSFLNGEVENPTLDYPGINPEKLAQEETELLALKDSIIRDEPNEVVAQAYRWRINERLAQVRMLKATANGDMHRFGRYAAFIYGEPDGGVFGYTVKTALEKAAKSIGEDSSIGQAAKDLVSILPDPKMEDQSIKKPDSQTIEAVAKIINSEFENLGLSDSEKEDFDSDDISSVFTKALESLGAEGWKILNVDNRTKVNVDQEQKEVLVPTGRQVARLKLEQLVIHEIMLHVGRREHGTKSRLSLLGLGLDRYIKGEEGVTTVAEQAHAGKVVAFRGLELHLAAALAKGLDGEPRDFRQTYEVLYKYFLFKELPKAKDKDQAEKTAQDKAYAHCVRVFRGTDCKTKGVIFPKDIVYREGNIAVWGLLKNNPNEALKFSIGKYDPANDRHLWILSQLGITDQVLEKLET